MLTIETRLDPLEINGKDVAGLPKVEDQVSVKAHWNCARLVVVEWHGLSFTLSGHELSRAIANAMNH